MPKPPTSTRTVRLTDALWATIKADAEARGEAVNAVIARHLRIAYAPKDKLTVGRIVDETVASPLGRRAAERVAQKPVRQALKDDFTPQITKHVKGGAEPPETIKVRHSPKIKVGTRVTLGGLEQQTVTSVGPVFIQLGPSRHKPGSRLKVKK